MNNNYWEEDLDTLLVTKYQIDPLNVIRYKKCVDRGYGKVWFEVILNDNSIKVFSLAGH